MNTITIHDKKYNVPTSWDDVNVKQYCQYAQFAIRYDLIDESESTKEGRILSILSGISYDTLQSCSMQEYNKGLQGLVFIANTIPDVPPSLIIEMEGKKYDVLDSIDLGTELGQFHDLEGWVFRNSKDNISKFLNMPELLSYMISPHGISYTSNECIGQTETRMKLISIQPITVMFPIFNFFLQREIALLRSSPAYLSQLTNLLKSEAVEALLKSYTRENTTGGGNILTGRLKAVFGTLNFYLLRILVRGYLTSRGK